MIILPYTIFWPWLTSFNMTVAAPPCTVAEHEWRMRALARRCLSGCPDWCTGESSSHPLPSNWHWGWIKTIYDKWQIWINIHSPTILVKIQGGFWPTATAFLFMCIFEYLFHMLRATCKQVQSQRNHHDCLRRICMPRSIWQSLSNPSRHFASARSCCLSLAPNNGNRSVTRGTGRRKETFQFLMEIREYDCGYGQGKKEHPEWHQWLTEGRRSLCIDGSFRRRQDLAAECVGREGEESWQSAGEWKHFAGRLAGCLELLNMIFDELWHFPKGKSRKRDTCWKIQYSLVIYIAMENGTFVWWIPYETSDVLSICHVSVARWVDPPCGSALPMWCSRTSWPQRRPSESPCGFQPTFGFQTHTLEKTSSRWWRRCWKTWAWRNVQTPLLGMTWFEVYRVERRNAPVWVLSSSWNPSWFSWTSPPAVWTPMRPTMWSWGWRTWLTTMAAMSCVPSTSHPQRRAGERVKDCNPWPPKKIQKGQWVK